MGNGIANPTPTVQRAKADPGTIAAGARIHKKYQGQAWDDTVNKIPDIRARTLTRNRVSEGLNQKRIMKHRAIPPKMRRTNLPERFPADDSWPSTLVKKP